MAVAITGRYLGNKKLSVKHGPSGTEIVTVPPVDNQGDGSSFSPTDLCAASLGACILTTIALYAEKKGVNLSGAHFKLEKVMAAEPRRIAEIPVEIHLPAALSEDLRPVLERVGSTCPVHHSLHPQTQMKIVYHYDVAADLV